MRILKLQQGTEEWNRERFKRLTASEAPAMMTASPKMKRNELLQMKALGTEKEFSDYVQKFLFDKGHEMEALARPIVESIVGEELYPATAESDCGTYLASFDGITMMGDILFEHKMWNEKLAESVRNGELDPEYYWQLEHQLMVSDAEKVCFVVSDGTEENMEYLWYTPVDGRRAELIKGWDQFSQDLFDYEPPAKTEIVIGDTPEDLPALLIQVEGAVKSTNLDLYKTTALRFIESINTDLQTDQDFADAESMVKFCKKSETELDSAKKHALAQTKSIDELFRTVDQLREKLRDKRLKLEKSVKVRKDEIRANLRTQSIEALSKYVGELNEKLEGNLIPDVTPDFGAAMKGKKTVESLQSAVDDELAKAKIVAKDWFTVIRENQFNYNELVTDDLKFLFSDVQQLLLKDPDSFKALIKSRLADHKETEAKRLDAERERIREEESAKLQQEKDAAEVPAGVKQEESPEYSVSQPQETTSLSRTSGAKKYMEGQKPPIELLVNAVAQAFGVPTERAKMFICNAANEIRGYNDSLRIGKKAAAFIARIREARSKDDLLAVGAEIQASTTAGDIDEIDDAWLQTQYRKKQVELRP